MNVLTGATIQLDVFHAGLELNMPELRFPKSHTLRQVKENLHRRTGTEPENMKLFLVDATGYGKLELTDDERQLIDLIPPEAENGWQLEVFDTDRNSISATPALLDTSHSAVPKYEAASATPEIKEFIRKCKREKQAKKRLATNTTGLAEIASFEEGQRVRTKAGLEGTVRYVGKCSEAAPGFFVGVELDQRKGKHDGTVGSKKLFHCREGHGLLLRPFALEILPNNNNKHEN